MGLVPTFFGIVTKQWPLLGYAGELPSVTAAGKISAPSLKLMLTQVTSRERKCPNRQGKKRTILSKRLESYRSQDYSRKVPAKFFC